MKRHQYEASEQAALMLWAQMHLAKYPQLRLLYHIPNGGSRNAAEAASLKRQGVKAGVPDLCLPVAKRGAARTVHRAEGGKEQGDKAAGGVDSRTAGAGI